MCSDYNLRMGGGPVKKHKQAIIMIAELGDDTTQDQLLPPVAVLSGMRVEVLFDVFRTPGHVQSSTALRSSPRATWYAGTVVSTNVRFRCSNSGTAYQYANILCLIPGCEGAGTEATQASL